MLDHVFFFFFFAVCLGRFCDRRGVEDEEGEGGGREKIYPPLFG
jgi:hypothetical protein